MMQNMMQNNQQFLIGILLILMIVIGFLVYDRRYTRETFGEKVGQTIDRATGELDN